MKPDSVVSRREAVQMMAGMLLLPAVPRGPRRNREPFPHPDPRPGITAEKVLGEDRIPDRKRMRAAFAAARERPELFDGIYCPCECSKEHRSLLVCFESAQPTGCYGCIEAAELVAEKAKDGMTLAEIRAAIDRKFG